MLAGRDGWPPADWAKVLAPFLSGEAQRAYYALLTDEAEDYTCLKAVVLARARLSPGAAAQQYQTWTYVPGVPPPVQMAQLQRIVYRWLQPERRGPNGVADQVVMDGFLRGLPPTDRRALAQQDPDTIQEMVLLGERAEAARSMTSLRPRENGIPMGPRTPPPRPNIPYSPKMTPGPFPV